MSSTSYLVTGANSGIGLRFVSELAKRSNVKIYATARTPSKATELQGLAGKYGNITVLQYWADSVQDSKAIAAVIEKEIGHLDFAFANAGSSTFPTSVIETKVDDFLVDYKVNTVGPIILFDAIYPLLEKVNGAFVAASTQVASMGDNPAPIKMASYGASKAALNYLIKRISIEHPQLRSMVLHPGWVITRMGNALGESMGVADIANVGGITVETSVDGIINVFDKIDQYPSGSFVKHDGSTIAW